MNRKNIDDHLEKALKAEPGFFLPEDFADKVLHKIEKRKEAEERKYAYSLIGIIVGFLILSGVCLGVFLRKEVLAQLMDVSGWAAVIGLLVVIIQVLDKKLLRKRAATLT